MWRTRGKYSTLEDSSTPLLGHEHKPLSVVHKKAPSITLFQKLSFSWVDRLIKLSSKGPLSIADLPKCGITDSPAYIFQQFDDAWQKCKAHTPMSLFACLLHVCGWKRIFLAGTIRLILDFLMLVNPFAMSRFIAFMGSDEDLWHGVMYGTAIVAQLTILAFGDVTSTYFI